MEDFVKGREATEWMNNKGIKSPDTSHMIPYKMDSMTIFYFTTKQRLEHFLIKNK